MYKQLLVILLFFVFLGAGCNIFKTEIKDNITTEIKQEQPIKKSGDKEGQYYEVVRVVDGDTVVVDIDGVGEKIRLIGIDTPETVDPRKPVQCFGIEASKKAKELLLNKFIALEKDESQGNRGKYYRLLRYIKTKEGLFYNLEIIKQGYAYEYTYDTPYKYQKEFKEAEDYARTNKLGLWADNTCSGKRTTTST